MVFGVQMKGVYRDRVIDSCRDWIPGRVFADREYHQCTFTNCAISLTRYPKRRSTLRNLKFIKCEQLNSSVNSAVIEDVLVEDLKTNGLFQSWAAVFKHVTLRGKIDNIMFGSVVLTGWATDVQQRAFDLANAAYYSTVDWALDISEAQFLEADLRGVPGRLVRRDPLTQILVTREKALQGGWRHLDLTGTYWPVALEFFLKRGNTDSIVLAAPKRARDFKRLLAGLQLLREAGVAEPD